MIVTMLLTPLIFAIGLLAVIATLVQTFREHAWRVAALAQQMHGSRPLGHLHFIVRTPAPRGPFNQRAVAVRLPDVRLAAG